MNELVSVEGITKHFNQRPALNDVSFSVRAGEVLGLIGPNGSGKTTLFECLAGLMAANAGTIKANNKPLSPSRRKETLFYLPDGIFPWPEQPVSWVLRFFKQLYERSE
jgi:ABC-2 type transport system ATP-binding protein